MPQRFLRIAALSFALLAHANNLGAQDVDVIRGQVTGPDDAPIENANVTATSVSGNVNRYARTDRGGRFTITFPGGEGDYFMGFTAIGFTPRRFEIKRTADHEILIADAKLQRAAPMLDTVRVAAEGADGDPAGFSVLGLSADQNNTTLNGNPFSSGSIQRDANVSTSVVTTPYDVSRGGFSGAQFSLRTGPGSNFIRRGNSLNLDAPALQWTDPTARALGQQYTNVSLGGALAGPIVMDKAFYNVSYQLGRRSNELYSLLNTSPLGLQSAGIAADSVARLVDLLERAGVPTLANGQSASNRLSDNGSLFGSMDLSRRNGQTFNVIFNGFWSRQTPAGPLTTEFPAQRRPHELERRHHGLAHRVREVDPQREQPGFQRQPAVWLAVLQPAERQRAGELHVRRRHEQRGTGQLRRQSVHRHQRPHTGSEREQPALVVQQEQQAPRQTHERAPAERHRDGGRDLARRLVSPVGGSPDPVRRAARREPLVHVAAVQPRRPGSLRRAQRRGAEPPVCQPAHLPTVDSGSAPSPRPRRPGWSTR